MAKRNKLAVFSVVALGMMFFAEQNKACTRAVYLGPDDMIANLSGGNQQKVIFGKWLERGPQIFMMDEPTRGIDVGTKVEIQKLVLKLASEGMSVTFISSETDEMLRTCSRLVVMRDRKVVGALTGDELTQSGIMATIAGGDN